MFFLGDLKPIITDTPISASELNFNYNLFIESINNISGNQIADQSVQSSKISDGAITNNHIEYLSVNSDKIGPYQVTNNKFEDNSITIDKLNVTVVEPDHRSGIYSGYPTIRTYGIFVQFNKRFADYPVVLVSPKKPSPGSPPSSIVVTDVGLESFHAIEQTFVPAYGEPRRSNNSFYWIAISPERLESNEY